LSGGAVGLRAEGLVVVGVEMVVGLEVVGGDVGLAVVGVEVGLAVVGLGVVSGAVGICVVGIAAGEDVGLCVLSQ
jgi:hypothetical protein